MRGDGCAVGASERMGTLRALVRAAGMSVDEFLELLQGGGGHRRCNLEVKLLPDEVGDVLTTLVEVAKPVTLLLSILSLYAVFHTAFLIPGRTVHDRLWDSLDLLVLAAGIAVVSGLIFRESEREVAHERGRVGGQQGTLAVRAGSRSGNAPEVTPLSGTLPMQIFIWGTGIMVGLFVVSWYLENYCIFYRDVRF